MVNDDCSVDLWTEDLCDGSSSVRSCKREQQADTQRAGAATPHHCTSYVCPRPLSKPTCASPSLSLPQARGVVLSSIATDTEEVAGMAEAEAAGDRAGGRGAEL